MSISINKLFLTGIIKKIENHTDSNGSNYLSLIISRHIKGIESSEFKVLVYKQTYINLVQNAVNCSILINGDVKQTLKKQDNEDDQPNSIYEFKDNVFMQVIIAQQIILLNKTAEMSDEDFITQLHSLNVFMLLGNAGQDPEVRTIPDRDDSTKNLKLVSLSIATNRPYKTANMEKKESVTWHKVTLVANYANNILQGLANLVSNYVKKGNKLFAIGSIQSKPFVSKTGEKKVSLQMILQNSAVTLSIIQDNNRRHDNSYDRAAALSSDNYSIDSNSTRDTANFYTKSNNSKQKNKNELDKEYDEDDDHIPF